MDAGNPEVPLVVIRSLFPIVFHIWNVAMKALLGDAQRKKRVAGTKKCHLSISFCFPWFNSQFWLGLPLLFVISYCLYLIPWVWIFLPSCFPCGCEVCVSVLMFPCLILSCFIAIVSCVVCIVFSFAFPVFNFRGVLWWSPFSYLPCFYLYPLSPLSSLLGRKGKRIQSFHCSDMGILI